jgi:hypothetical protein
MLFLYRPRQTWMPYRPPRRRTERDAYNLHLQQAYAATRQAAPYTPAAAPQSAADDPIASLRELAQLRESGVLSDAEFAAAKAKVLGLEGNAP